MGSRQTRKGLECGWRVCPPVLPAVCGRWHCGRQSIMMWRAQSADSCLHACVFDCSYQKSSGEGGLPVKGAKPGGCMLLPLHRRGEDAHGGAVCGGTRRRLAAAASATCQWLNVPRLAATALCASLQPQEDTN
eukprot:jgi/Ulvmu1/11193/UM072_0029.1